MVARRVSEGDARDFARPSLTLRATGGLPPPLIGLARQSIGDQTGARAEMSEMWSADPSASAAMPVVRPAPGGGAAAETSAAAKDAC